MTIAQQLTNHPYPELQCRGKIESPKHLFVAYPLLELQSVQIAQLVQSPVFRSASDDGRGQGSLVLCLELSQYKTSC